MSISWSVERAIDSGIEAARHAKSDSAEAPYQNSHPMFNYWFSALVTKGNCRDWDDKRIKQHVLSQCTRKEGTKGY